MSNLLQYIKLETNVEHANFKEKDTLGWPRNQSRDLLAVRQQPHNILMKYFTVKQKHKEELKLQLILTKQKKNSLHLKLQFEYWW